MRGDEHFGLRSFVDKATHHPVEVLVTSSKKGSGEQQKQGEQTFPSIFCKVSHFNDNCDKHTTFCDCKQQESLQGQCFICLRVRHLFKSCDSCKKCCYCKKAAHHNRCICPKQFPMFSEDPTVSQSLPVNVNCTGSEDNQSSDTADNDTSLAISAKVDKPASGSDHMV